MDITLGQITVTSAAKPNAPSQGGGTARQSTELTLSQARARSPFPFAEPSYIPSGFDFADAAVVESPATLIVLSYASPSGPNFTLVEAPLNQYKLGPDGKRRYLVVADSIEEASISGAPAARAQQDARPGGPVALGFIWEDGGRLNHIIGLGLSESELARIAASTS